GCGDPVEREGMLGCGEWGLRQGSGARPAGERTRLFAKIGEQADCFPDGCRTVVGEGTRYQAILPDVSRAGPRSIQLADPPFPPSLAGREGGCRLFAL